MSTRAKIRGLASALLLKTAFANGLRPDPVETIDQWCDRERRLSQEGSAEFGKYKTSRTPYLREIMECLSPSSPVERIVVMKSAQVGASELGNNFLAYVIAKGLGPTLLVQATLDGAKDYSKQRLDPMIRDTPILNRILGSRSDAKNSSNTLFFKSFPGGVMLLRGAESASGLRSMPIRNLFLDEIDAYPRDVEGEGDPCDLALKRTETFSRRKILEVSTPTVEGMSRIAERFALTDQRYFLVPCPHCETFQRLVWPRLQFERTEDGLLDPESIGYACESCGVLIEEKYKPGMVAQGRWEATTVSKSRVVRGYHINALYSPWCKWETIIAQKLDVGRNPRRLQTWVNTYLGETWEAEGEAPDWGKLWRRREPYTKDLLPKRVAILTAGVDAQKDRLEMEIVGWGPGLESWSIDYVVITGDTTTPKPYDELAQYLQRTWKHENGGSLSISRMMIDAGDASHSAPTIMRWARYRTPRVMPCRGRGDASQMVYSPRELTLRKGNSRGARAGMFWPVGVGLVKSELYGWLRQKEAPTGVQTPAGWCHFPRAYDEDYFQQITAERKIVKRNQKGIPVAAWKVIEGRRNEVLDCRVYARAAAYVHGIDGWAPAKWAAEFEKTRETETEQPKRKVKLKPKPKRGGFLGGRKETWLGQ